MDELKAIKVKKTSVILDADKFEGLKETLEILSNNELVRSISKALSEPKDKRKSHKDIFYTK
jgi:PHD/YefM family antitoxin component YafN of YafNO toxin-antitoxin module